jgi:hypothetical protein
MATMGEDLTPQALGWRRQSRTGWSDSEADESRLGKIAFASDQAAEDTAERKKKCVNR